jgi:hypothetical protein
MATRKEMSSTVRVAAQTLLYWFLINLLDFAPNFLRRSMLANEYEGEALEKRLQMKIGGGWRVLAALWRMSSINLRPAVSEGSLVPPGTVVTTLRVEDGEEAPQIDLADYYNNDDDVPATKKVSTRNLLPLVLNFGSCS